jgi:MoaA/NifB/PqqE/SkfB family radical SAM enzyme
MLNVSDMQRYMPAGMKFFLKRYYRTVFPNKLILIFNPTSRCNYRCSYCPVITKFDYTTVFPKNQEKSVSDWLRAFEQLPPAMVYIAGGEPFVYNGLPDLVNQLPGKHQIVGIVTNLSQDVRLYRKMKRKIHIRASFHREFIGQEEFVSKVKALSDQFYIHVNIVATPENLPLIEEVSGGMARDNVTLHVDPYVDLNFRYSPEQRALLDRVLRSDRNPDSQLDFTDFSEKSCSAGRNYINVASNGDVYTCNGGMHYLHSSMYAAFPNPAGMDLQKFRMGNLFDPGFALNKTNITCTLPCKEACDRDSVAVRRIGPGPATAPEAGLRVIS